MKAKRGNRERPISFTKMDDIKNRWESTSQQGRRESQREARKEEIAGIRSRLFMVRMLWPLFARCHAKDDAFQEGVWVFFSVAEPWIGIVVERCCIYEVYI